MKNEADFAYAGNELDLFLHAVNWKTYWSTRVRPYVSGAVLDVGAGLGATFDYLHDAASAWTCLEPDATLRQRLARRLSAHPRAPRIVGGTIADLGPELRFDTILYVDVLEHIEHDGAELALAQRHLDPGGSLVVLSPALPILYSRFDARIGHHRRYTLRTLSMAAPSGLKLKSWFFLDGLGVLASLFARVAKREAPTPRQIATWDKVLLPVSRMTDTVTSRWFGRSIVAVWIKD